MSKTRKEIAMEYEFKRNAVPSTSTDESRHVRGGVAIQRENLATSVAVDEPSGALQRRTRTSGHPDSSTGSPLAAFVARTFRSHAPRATILVRLIVGGVFLTEGIQKFLFAGELGVGRFTKIGIPFPEVMAPFVGVVEIVGGVLLLVGLLTRLATIPLIIDMFVAIESTKMPILFKDGPWKMIHESRVDGSMLLGSIFLLIVGAGAWSLDAWCLAGIGRSHREGDASLPKGPRRREQ
jgi:putative oxidoreductase